MRVRMLLTICVALILFVATSNGQALRDDPDLPDSVMVDSVVAYLTGPGIVPINFFNDEPLAGIEVTMIYDSPDVTVDSFSFVGSRVEYATFKGISTSDSTATIYCFPVGEEALIAAGSGLFGYLHFSYLPTIDTQVVAIDSIRIIDYDVEYSTTFSDSASNAFKPQFQKGYLDIQEATSCCIGDRGNVDGDPSEAVNVGDITYLVDFIFFGGPEPPCTIEANVDGDSQESVNVGDVTYLVDYIFFSGDPPPPCP
jgi:hypothetical protein